MASGATGTYGLPYPLQTDAVDVAADVQSLATQTEIQLILKAPIESPTFTGNPTAPTPNNSDNDTSIATTAFVKNQSYLTTTTAASTYAPIASPAFTGTVTTAGSLGVAHATPPVRLSVSGSASVAAPALGVASGSMLVTNNDNSYGLLVGSNGANGSSWLQVQRVDTVATAYNLILQPSGGNVGVGVLAPTARLGVAASSTTAASLNIPHGTAPSSPNNGDVWTTTVGMYARINGSTIGPFGTGATYQGTSPTAITGALWADSNYNSLSVYTGTRWASLTGTNVPLAKTASYTLTVGDEGSIIQMNGATTNGVIVPTNSTQSFPIGSSIMIVQTSSVQTVISGAGVTFIVTPGLKLRTQNSVATLLKVATDTWVVSGDLIA